MSALTLLAEEYLETRRALGYKLTSQARILAGFVGYLDTAGATRITVETALGFATLPAEAHPIWWTRRLSVVRGFATYMQAIDPTTEVPPTGLFARGTPRATPYFYTPAEIAALMAAAHALRPPLHAATYETLIGLLAVTGMRVGEAIALGRDQLDIDRGLLIVRAGKFGKDRLVPLHPTTIEALQLYAQRRDTQWPASTASTFFVSTVNTRLTYNTVRVVFARLAGQAGLVARGRCSPRMHDFRHRFAVETLLGWYRSGDDVAARLPLLSTFLGHVKPTSTYWYLSATPELLALAAGRLERQEVAR
jgi:integrase/recombinase XerD